MTTTPSYAPNGSLASGVRNLEHLTQCSTLKFTTGCPHLSSRFLQKNMNEPKIQVKLIYTNGRRWIPTKPEKRKIVAKISTASIKSVYLKVTYLPDVFNEGTYDNKKDALQFIRSCYEKEQLEFVYGGEW